MSVIEQLAVVAAKMFDEMTETERKGVIVYLHYHLLSPTSKQVFNALVEGEK